jgi:hypothetical protein
MDKILKLVFGLILLFLFLLFTSIFGLGGFLFMVGLLAVIIYAFE